jgi:RNA-directed DNA polymerase
MTEQLVGRMGLEGRMGPEANALGKAQGYADGTPEESMAEASSTSQTSVSNQVLPGMYDWADIPWPQVVRKVHKLQRRIYRASQRNDPKKVHALQRLLLRSWYARLLAVRRVTQDNQGKRTAGIDGIASLEPEDRLALAQTLDLEQPPQPVRRIWIPKPGSDEQRPLGIPTLGDRAQQAWVLQALEPEWEAKFEPNSYGFRPGRSCHDAIAAIFLSICRQPKAVLDADIAKCFDRMAQEPLLDKLQTFPRLRRLIKGWLEAGVMDGDQLFPTKEGTPQGGVLSPLLANVALHGMENFLHDAFPKGITVQGRPVKGTPTLIRYADDFVVLHSEQAVIQHCQHLLQEWLRPLGLELKPSKTRIRHTREPKDGETGFDFLGFTSRQFPVGQHHSGKNGRGKLRGFKTIIRPSATKIQLHIQRLRDLIRRHRTASQETLIGRLNPMISGWCNYHRTVVSKTIFASCDMKLYQQLRRWAYRRHPGKGKGWIARRYWQLPRWTFGPKNGPPLRRHHTTRITRPIKVQGSRSPYDGEWGYWAGRLGRYPGMPLWKARSLRDQNGRCVHCGLYFRPGDLLELHHNRQHQPPTLELLHRHCHDTVHRHRTTEPLAGIHDKDGSSEEPYECESLTYGFEEQPGG